VCAIKQGIAQGHQHDIQALARQLEGDGFADACVIVCG